MLVTHPLFPTQSETEIDSQRESFIEPKVKLIQGTPLSGLLEKMLSCQQSSIAPYNVKAKMITDGEKLLSDGLSLAKTADLFAVIVANLGWLQDLAFEEKSVIANSIRESLHTLITCTDNASSELNVSINQMKEKFIKSTEDLVNTNQKAQTANSEYQVLQSKLVGLNQQKNDLDKEITTTKLEIQNLNQQIMDEQETRNNACLDLIPLYGLIDGLIKNKPLRMIPFYSGIVGIISICSQNKENAERRLSIVNSQATKLSSDIDSISNEIELKNNETTELSNKMNMLRTLILSTDNLIRQRGMDLTVLRQTNQNLKEIVTKCQYLEMDVDLTIEIAEENMH